MHAAAFFARNEWPGVLVLGSVFLVVTGGEALYADIGHFGRRPIRVSWFALVLPALLLNYFGQGALIINDPAAVEQPFFLLAPDWALYPLVVLATAATVIASQAVISGAFSLTRQAVQLGYLPRVTVEHTSASHIGQIYVANVNRALLIACVALVLGFGSSSALAAAYGVAVTTDMVFTTILFAVVASTVWRWSLVFVLLLAAVFLGIDLAFWGANIVKVPEGGWFPLAVAAGVFTVMTTWKRGRQILADRMASASLPIDLFLQSLTSSPPARVPGIAVYMQGTPTGTPPALLHNLKHNKVLHERVIFLTVVTRDVPHVPEEERLELAEIGHGVFRLQVFYGFMEDPDVPAALRQCRSHGLVFPPMETSYFLGRETLIPSRRRRGMAFWREALFSFLSRNAQRATAYYRIPPNRVIELGAQIEL
jgi:KUP system potassium uptake protein